jgi:hypothetical protein
MVALPYSGGVLIWEILCVPLRLFAYFAVKKPLKQLTAKSAENTKITEELNSGHYLRKTIQLAARPTTDSPPNDQERGQAHLPD